ncbi:hypothetical protein PanWU01x14_328750 [Parasponia andersonii]|uniref:Uncharacterized protein n=1 Tax=Parasponia andersonii TaxID=3476 RepID=A0A2P5AIL9_PARAD|nr:hypothetical protein PanWU01x14_328750 [Parasponia andersonii]
MGATCLNTPSFSQLSPDLSHDFLAETSIFRRASDEALPGITERRYHLRSTVGGKTILAPLSRCLTTYHSLSVML